jgi:hypothetical protein
MLPVGPIALVGSPVVNDKSEELEDPELEDSELEDSELEDSELEDSELDPDV